MTCCRGEEKKERRKSRNRCAVQSQHISLSNDGERGNSVRLACESGFLKKEARSYGHFLVSHILYVLLA